MTGRIHASNADRQRAYRQRKAAERAATPPPRCAALTENDNQCRRVAVAGRWCWEHDRLWRLWTHHEAVRRQDPTLCRLLRDRFLGVWRGEPHDHAAYMVERARHEAAAARKTGALPDGSGPQAMVDLVRGKREREARVTAELERLAQDERNTLKKYAEYIFAETKHWGRPASSGPIQLGPGKIPKPKPVQKWVEDPIMLGPGSIVTADVTSPVTEPDEDDKP
jgi:hypothetical protein